eukprot:SAG22_NODE_9727_length_573_cov_0.947257_1_plen_54_part_01
MRCLGPATQVNGLVSVAMRQTADIAREMYHGEQLAVLAEELAAEIERLRKDMAA